MICGCTCECGPVWIYDCCWCTVCRQKSRFWWKQSFIFFMVTWRYYFYHCFNIDIQKSSFLFLSLSVAVGWMLIRAPQHSFFYEMGLSKLLYIIQTSLVTVKLCGFCVAQSQTKIAQSSQAGLCGFICITKWGKTAVSAKVLTMVSAQIQVVLITGLFK